MPLNKSHTFLIVHGWLLWVSWTLIGFVMIVSMRYFKYAYKWRVFTHAVLGISSTLLNLIYGLGAIYKNDGRVSFTVHGILGTLFSCLMVLNCFLGFFCHTLLTHTIWKGKCLQRVTRIHKLLSYLILGFGQCIVLGGLISFYRMFETNGYTDRAVDLSYLGFINAGVFAVLIGWLEVWQWLKTRNGGIALRVNCVSDDNKPRIISIDEFDRLVDKGEQLAIINDKVVNLREYSSHPGGKFTLQANIGRDIAKFFDGGYSMESGVNPVNHSYQALRVFDKLTIGYLNNQAVQSEAKIASYLYLNKHTAIIKFSTPKVVQGMKSYYSRFKDHGRHFQLAFPKLKIVRYYTTCNCMQPSVYQEYLRIINKALFSKDNRVIYLDNTLFDESNVDSVHLVIKNYNKKGGLSEFIHQSIAKGCENIPTDITENCGVEQIEVTLTPCEQIYYLKGPMGKGLQVKSTGVHIAFTGGTGCLLFLDLVAHLVRKNLGLLHNNEDSLLNSFCEDEPFKLVLYMSFVSRKESCGLKLCEGLRDICQKYKIENFELHLRFSDLKVPRWDKDFIHRELLRFQGKVNKIWVCGPPLMNETFDQNLQNMKGEFGLKSHQIEVI
ncbi:hypothetical protein FGO68_gene3814 [Halteria grandinella]|uniref:Uncharacterized protein n=1 Tax=Halteria grandinella TaxID=5974 RepID=A0A8J8T494_HALGN|nr:hypothetical protein FGO68_gene3814 [Halteria grandinella]